MAAQENGSLAVAQAQDGLAGLSVGNGDAGAIVPVGEARTVLPSPDLSAVQAVQTQTQAIGIIHPPPDIKAIVDKAANFVAKNGALLLVFDRDLERKKEEVNERGGAEEGKYFFTPRTRQEGVAQARVRHMRPTCSDTACF